MRPLPAASFTYDEWKTAEVNVDYHDYPVPHSLIHQVVEAAWSRRSSAADASRNKGYRAHAASRRESPSPPT